MTSRRKLLDWLVVVAAVFAVVAIARTSAAAPTTRAATGPATRPLDPDLVGWWRADRAGALAAAAADLSGKHHDAKPIAGEIALEKTDDRLGFRFKPDWRALSAGADDAFNFTSDFTVALWAKVANDRGDMTLLSKSHAWAVVHGIKGIGGVGFLALPQVTMPTPCKAVDGWVHIAVTFQWKKLLLYVDGKAIGIAELETVPLGSKDALIFGAGSDGKNGMDGWLDDIRIYHRALIASDIEGLAAGREPENPYVPLTVEEERRVLELVNELGADSYGRRERAAAELKKRGRRVVPLLRRYLDSEDQEISLRIKTILGELPKAEKEK